MSLTMNHAPLAANGPRCVNYRIEGPPHRLFLQPFSRRVRAVFGGETVLDTRRGMLLHESQLLPVLYVPEEDMRLDLLEATDHTSHCPFKGDASYWSVRVGSRAAENAVWAYLDPLEAAPWLAGLRALYWETMDRWLDEDEPVEGHLRDPYHRVDVRRSSRHVRVLAGDEVIADSDRPMLLSETGLPNRYYLPAEAVRAGVLEESRTTTVCPYKGTAAYRSLRLDGRVVPDAAWLYPQPLENALKVGGYLCFDHDELTTELDGGR